MTPPHPLLQRRGRHRRITGAWVVAALLTCTTACNVASPELPNRDPHGPRNVAAYIDNLDSASRDAYQMPDAVVRALGLRPDDVVADVGCGPGYFTRRLARAVPAGVVYAVDVEPRQLDRLNAHLRDEGLVNVVPVLATAADPHLPPGRLDMILVVDTYHHFDNRAQYLQTLKRGLKPAGRLVLIDYRKDPLPVGPPVAHKLAREQELSETESAGFQLIDEPTFLPYQYFLIFASRIADR